MSEYINMDTLRFQLFEVHGLAGVLEHARFSEIDLESVDLLLDSVKDFSDAELYPCFREMDEQPAHYKDGGIVVHPQVKTFMQQSAELGLIGSGFDFEDGGLQLPEMVSQATSYIMEAANNNATGYVLLTSGAAGLIVSFGSQELKDTYVPKMLSGEWGGTMCLTEPQAGSSLSDIVTSATPKEDGSYRIKGHKIFISGGDHEYCDNFVHLVLARIDGAPAGTRGISLFAVPKHRITEGGGLHPNDVRTEADYQKMGQKGYCTTHLVFGEDEDCYGWLVGEPHKGLSYMFQMMNEARIAVGRGATSIACAAYHASLQYAKERPQGRKIQQSGQKDASQDQTLIINHPDVRRMLLLQKAIYEGSLSLVLQAAQYADMAHVSTGAEKDRYQHLLEILTPVAKTYPAEKGRTSVDNGLQVLGGYGFCNDFVLQQYYRDIRIYAIYEGTTGIQSLDLLGRKMQMKGGQALKWLMEEIQETLEQAMTHESLRPYAGQLGQRLKQAEHVLNHLMGVAKTGNFELFLSDATLFMEMMGTLLVSWQWLKMAAVAQEALLTGNGSQTQEAYRQTIHTMRFFFTYELPRVGGLVEILQNQEQLTLSEGLVEIA